MIAVALVFALHAFQGEPRRLGERLRRYSLLTGGETLVG